MIRILTIVGLMGFCLQAAAGEKTAVVSNTYDDPSQHDKIACEMRLQSVLREMGYRLLPRTTKKKVALQVNTWCSCYNRGMLNFTCNAGAVVHKSNVPRFAIHVGPVNSNSDGWARDEACREMAKKLRDRLGGRVQAGGDDVKPLAPKKTHQIVTVRWKGNLKSMPLIMLTGFFKDMGYPAKMLKSSANQVRFRVTIEEQPERFRSKVRTFLDAHYRIVSVSGKSKLSYQIEAL